MQMAKMPNFPLLLMNCVIQKVSAEQLILKKECSGIFLSSNFSCCIAKPASVVEKLLRLAHPHERPAGTNRFHTGLYTTTACWLLFASWPSSSSFLKAANICHVKKKIVLYFILPLSQIWSLPPKFPLLEELFCSEVSQTVSTLWATGAQNFRTIPLEFRTYFTSTFCFALFSLVIFVFPCNLNSIVCGLPFIYMSLM